MTHSCIFNLPCQFLGVSHFIHDFDQQAPLYPNVKPFLYSYHLVQTEHSSDWTQNNALRFLPSNHEAHIEEALAVDAVQ